MLITHSSIVNSFIVVFNTSNGNVLSARKYSEGGFSNYNEAFNSMLLSPSHLHSAYVLSNYDFSSRLCTGQHLFKFDPVIFSNEPIWIKKNNRDRKLWSSGISIWKIRIIDICIFMAQWI